MPVAFLGRYTSNFFYVVGLIFRSRPMVYLPMEDFRYGDATNFFNIFIILYLFRFKP